MTDLLYLVLLLTRKITHCFRFFSLVLVSVLRTSINVLSKSKSKNYVTWIANLTKLFLSVYLWSIHPPSGQPTLPLVNPFSGQPVLVQTGSGPNLFWSKPVLVQTRSGPNPFSSKPVLIQTHSNSRSSWNGSHRSCFNWSLFIT